MRLDAPETSIVVSDVTFLTNDDHEESDEDAPAAQPEEEDEGEEEDVQASPSSKRKAECSTSCTIIYKIEE